MYTPKMKSWLRHCEILPLAIRERVLVSCCRPYEGCYMAQPTVFCLSVCSQTWSVPFSLISSLVVFFSPRNTRRCSAAPPHLTCRMFKMPDAICTVFGALQRRFVAATTYSYVIRIFEYFATEYLNSIFRTNASHTDNTATGPVN